MAVHQESVEQPSTSPCGMHRALASPVEELEAVDCYNQRVDVCTDPGFDHELRDCLFADKTIAHQ